MKLLTINKSPEHVLAILFSSTVEKTEIETMAKACNDKLAANDRLGLLIDMSKWSDITGDAIIEDIKFEFGLLSKLSRFPRMAVVSNKQFVKAIMTFFDPLVPMTDIKVFGPNEYDKALAFASDLPAPKPVGKPSTRIIETGDPKLINYEIDGRLTMDDIERVVQPLQKAFEKDEKIDLLVRMKNYAGFDPSILIQPSVIAVKLSSIRYLRRYAIVGTEDWLKNLSGMFAWLSPIELKFFNVAQEDEAWAWVKS
jgi:hypothetical protein